MPSILVHQVQRMFGLKMPKPKCSSTLHTFTYWNHKKMDSDGSPNLHLMPYVKRVAFPMHWLFVWTLQAASCSALVRIQKCRKYVEVPGSRIF